MPRLYLCVDLSPDSDEKPSVSLSVKHPPNSQEGCVKRYSPIYKIQDLNNNNPLSIGDGVILFLFTHDSYYTIGKLINNIDIKLMPTVHLYSSYGMASVILFVDNKNDIEKILSSVSADIAGYEIWYLDDRKIIKIDSKLFGKAKRGYCFNGYDGLGQEDKHVVTDIIQSLNYAYRIASQYSTKYIPFLDQISITCQDIVCDSLYLLGNYDECELQDYYEGQYKDNANVESIRLVGDLKKIKANPKLRIKHLHQLKDEIVQISAILKSINSQAFSGIAPILNSPYRTGEHSLLGISLSHAALFSVYSFVRKIFSSYDIDSFIQNEFPNIQAPKYIESPPAYIKWRKKLKKIKSVKDIQKKEGAAYKYHFVYYSNRLGFRETKHSISAAYQCLCYSSIPPWTLTTVTHEFSHAVNRAVMGNIYPLVNEDDTESMEKILSKFNNRDRNTGNLIDLFSIVFVDSLRHLVSYEEAQDQEEVPIKEDLTPEEIQQNLKRKYHLFDEIMTHLTDYYTFFNCKDELYIESIWTSWLSLPVTLARIDEYLLRTICTIGSTRDGEVHDRFDYAYNKMSSTLAKCKVYNLDIGMDVLKVAQERIEDKSVKRKLMGDFFGLCCLIDSTVELLLCDSIVTEMQSDKDMAQQGDLKTYSYDLEVGKFTTRRIYNPITFLIDFLKNSTRTGLKPSVDNQRDIESKSLWLFSLLASSLSYYEKG